MNFDLTEEQELVRRTVRDFAEEKIAPVAEELDREHRFPYELVAELAELGLMGMPIPQAYGGGGGDTLSYAIAIEELTRIDSSVAITVATSGKTGTICTSKAPESCAAPARSCDSAEYSSSRVRENPHFFAIISADNPWLNEKSS